MRFLTLEDPLGSRNLEPDLQLGELDDPVPDVAILGHVSMGAVLGSGDQLIERRALAKLRIFFLTKRTRLTGAILV